MASSRLERTAVRILTVVLLAIVFASCSTTRLVEEGQYRLAKNSVEVTNDKKFSTKDIESYIKQKSNSYLVFGWNPFLNFYNWSGKDGSKAINKVIRKIGVAPVVYESEKVDETLENIERHLEYLGYYSSDVKSHISVKKRKVNVTYSVTLGKRFTIGDITYSVTEGSFYDDFKNDSLNVSIKKGDFLSEKALEEEAERSSAYYRKNGYFGFTKNFYSFEADTLERTDTASLKMIIKNYTRNQTADNVRPLRKYVIGDVEISYDKSLRFNERDLKNINTITPGTIYDENIVNNTYSRFSSLKSFSGVNIEMTPRENADTVDCRINLTRSRMQGFKVNFESSVNSTGLIGVSPQLSYYHKNIFHGGQWLNLGFVGNFQFKANDTKVKSNEFGINGSINFPKFIGLPNTLFISKSLPHTEISASYNFQNRPEYTRNIISTSYGHSVSLHGGHTFLQFQPIQVKIVRLYNLDENFYKTLSGNPFLRDAYQNHFDVGIGFTGYFSSVVDLNPKEDYQYARLQFNSSGNVLSAFNNGMKTDEYGSRLIWGTPYSQYVRGEVTLVKAIVFGKSDKQAIAMRLLAGAGHSYGNSTALPFEKQFYSGGANSMRGWQTRALGPGASQADSTFVIPSQTGDLKLEANLEYRFPMFWKFNGALFADAGNVWNLKKTGDNDLGVFKFDNIFKTMAANWGLGVRLDLNFLILRLDLGIKLYDPMYSAKKWYGPSSWLDTNTYALHFGVGHPF